MEFDEFDEFDDGLDDLDMIKALEQVENHVKEDPVYGQPSKENLGLPSSIVRGGLKPGSTLDQNATFAHQNAAHKSMKISVKSKCRQQTVLDHFKPANPAQSLIKDSCNNPPQSLLSLNTHPNIQSKPKAHNPKRPGAVKSYHPIDEEALKTWIFPINYSIRDYQFNIAQSALFSNTLVCLPTGLGKTFVAAVVIYNYLRWFPESCVVFTAPTKPLVAQQVEACQKITGIGNELIAELTGNKSADTRRISWSKRRLFFMTPETFRNDLQSNCCDVEKIALVIFDEAHRASGQYAYCEIIKALESERAVFRVLALSATPANDPRKVQGVIQNLYIERLQLRTEDSFDVAPFIFKKTIEEIVVKPSPLMNLILEKFLPFLEAPIRRLKQNHCINFDNAATIAPYFLLKAREGWRTRKASLPQAVQGMIEGDFGLAHTLAGFRDLLLNCGIRAFYEKVHAFILEIKQKSNSSRKKLELVKNQAFISLMQMLEEKMTEKDFSSHPKLDILVEVVVEHFKKHEKTIQDAMKHGDLDIQNETKVMIFSTLRSSVEEICNLLEKHSPLVRPSIFVGQATSGKNNIGMKQKEQLMMMENFRNGLFNVIVATSIGEEGLDIGELDLIICFDSQKSPIRMLQRCGRTGRKRKGKICLLVNEGAEQAAVKKAKDQYKAVQNSIIDGSRLEMYCGDLAAILPEDCNPECSKEFLVVADSTEKQASTSRVSKNPKVESAQLLDYMTKNRIAFENTPKINLANQTHWQTTHLPIIKIEHSSLSSMYVNLMQFCYEQRQEEAKCFPDIIHDTQFKTLPSSIHLSPIHDPILDRKKSKFQFDNLLDESFLDKSFSDDSDFLNADKKTSAFKSHSATEKVGIQSIDDASDQSIEIIEFISRNELSINISEPNDEVVHKSDSNEIKSDAGPDSIDEFSDLELDMSFGDHKSLQPSMSTNENEGISIQRIEPDDMSTRKDKHVFLEPLVQKMGADRILIPPTPVALYSNGNQAPSFSIAMQRKMGKRKLISETSSNMGESPLDKGNIKHCTNKTSLKYHSSDHLERMKKPKRYLQTSLNKKLKSELIQGFVDIEVDVSSGQDISSDEEGSYLDQDLSGFIASADLNSSEIQIENIPGFYRESLLKSHHLKYGNKFKLSRGISLGRPIGSGNGLAGSSENDSLNSLEDFLCKDDEVEFESQVNSLLDDSIIDTQPSSAAIHPTASEQQINNNSINLDNVDELDLSDMLDF